MSMTKHHPENERVKRRYLDFLKAAKGLSEASLDGVVKAIHRFEEATNFRDFRKFHIEQAIAFRTDLGEETNSATGEPLSRSTVLSTLNALRTFFLWLADQPGYRKRIKYADAEYFRLSERETRIAKARRQRPVPTLEQIHHMLDVMPAKTDVERRDRAVLALLALTGCRDGALITLKLKHLDLVESRLILDAREVGTKFGKTFTTWFYPVGGHAVGILEDYVRLLKVDRLWGNDDPLFPATEVLVKGGEFVAGGLTRSHWHFAGPIRDILRYAGVVSGLPYFNPHSIRNALVQLGFRACKSIEELKAWSQNMGHTDMLTTFTSYGAIPEWRQGELIRKLAVTKGPSDEDLTREAAEFIRRVRG